VDGLMTIRAFSDRFGLSQKCLWTDAADDLLVPSAVDSASGHGYYAPSEVRDETAR